MGGLANMPNGENCSQAELDIAAGAVCSRRSHVRLMAIKALLLGGVLYQFAVKEVIWGDPF